LPKSKPVQKKPKAPSRPAAKSAREPAKARPAAAPVATKGAKKAEPAASAKHAPKKAEEAPKPKPKKAPALLTIVPEVPATLAPGKFRREYKRWKDVLISLRHRLLSEGSHLEEEGLKALEQEVSVDHMADFGSDSSEQETTLQLIESNSLSLRDVDDALKRIEKGTYGLCEDCEALIPPARLEVLPHARLCIACQEKREGMPA
jgi:DnaK suppressor protein